MNVALIIPGSLWYAPYVRIYTRILDNTNTSYSIISWNREGDDKPEGIQYQKKCPNGHYSAGYSAYKGYLSFIKNQISKYRFDRIIVFGPQMTCLLAPYLLRKFRGRYMIDYRDLSIDQRFGFKQLFSIMLRFSCANVISSSGFLKCLPKRSYFLSHNFDVNAVKEAINTPLQGSFYCEGEIRILTIGAIRDYSSNIEVVKALANKKNINMQFVGKGDGAIQIERYCKENDVKNISFVGFYRKQEEKSYVKDCSFMNIFYPRVITHDTALSNRFYNSLIYKKPMIVTKNTTQGDYVEKYQVGIAMENCNNIEYELRCFLNLDYLSYVKRCNCLLESFLKDQEDFERAVKRFVES